ncbi:uncharacterized protein [Nicotiana sylvestris]|uniref:uncharacterized protein n=1 Tax=Nicotiana sylvestris TaxID=4096 RepID=UPI00388C663E
MPELVVPKAKAPLPRPPPPYPQRLAKQKNDNQFKKFIDMMKNLSINVPLVEALEQVPGYAKFMKYLVTKKRSIDCETIKMTHQVSAIVHSMALKLEDPDCEVDFEVPIILGRPFLAMGKALVDVEPVDGTSSMIHVEEPIEAVLLNMDVNDDASKVECVNALHGMGSYSYDPRKLSLDLGNRKTPPTKPSIEEPPIDATLAVLQKRKKVIGWTLADIRGTSPVFCMHKIILEEDERPSLEHQRRLNEAIQEVVKKEFRPYLMGAKVIVHTDHAALRYLMTKKDSKARLIRWVLLLQEFDLEIVDRKGSKNQVADHLSHLEEEGRPCNDLEINDAFPNEQLLAVSMNGMSWFADVTNYLVTGIIPCELSSNQRKKLKRDSLDFYCDEPYLFKI